MPQVSGATQGSYASIPVVVINMTESEKNKLGRVKKDDRVSYVRTIVQNHRPDIYESYFVGIPWDQSHCWIVNAQSTYNKYGLATLSMQDARSTSTNVKKCDQKKNVMMLYAHENQLFISPWKGRIADDAAGATSSLIQ
jgi:hypothetical protein